MSMKHEYKLGDVVWYKGEKVTFQGLDATDDSRFYYSDNPSSTSTGHGFTKYLSPYPPVKAVERYVVVDDQGDMYDEESQKPTEQLSIEAFCKWYNTDNWDELEQQGYRCIPVTITAKKDNNE